MLQNCDKCTFVSILMLVQCTHPSVSWTWHINTLACVHYFVTVHLESQLTQLLIYKCTSIGYTYKKMFSSHIGPYSRKRINYYSPGISLTKKTWFIFLLNCILILPVQNSESSYKKYWKLKSFLPHYYFPYYSIVKRTRKINQVCVVRLIPGIRADLSYCISRNFRGVFIFANFAS